MSQTSLVVQREKAEDKARKAAAAAKLAAVRADLDAQVAANTGRRMAEPMSDVEKQINARLLRQIAQLQAC